MMFTGITHHQPPHQFSPNVHSSSQNGAFQDILSNPLLGKRSGEARPLDLWKKFQGSRQYPNPLLSPTLDPVCTPLRNAGPRRMDVSEHMLRRKTPNGTLAAGYDGTPVEWTRPHATKYLLMPTPERRRGELYHSAQVEVVSNNDPSLHTVPPRRSDHIHQGRRATDTTEIEGSRNSGASDWGPNESLPLRVDSVLNQNSVFQDFYNSTGPQAVPTVLQPMWPPCIGLTASSNQGPYGPYWPNGTYVPYRPAALRDPRFQSREAGFGHEASFQPQLQPSDSGAWPYDRGINLGGNGSDVFAHKPIARSGFEPADEFQSSQLERTAHGRAEDTTKVPTYGVKQGQAVPLAYRTKPPPATNSGTYQSSCWSRASFPSTPVQTQALSPLLGKPDVHISNLQFKEKVLVWAHRIYLNLLASVHQARRNAHSKHHSTDRQQIHVSIYPRPPRHPLSATQVCSKAGNLGSTDVLTYSKVAPTHLGGRPEPNGGTAPSQPKVEGDRTWYPSNNSSFFCDRPSWRRRPGEQQNHVGANYDKRGAPTVSMSTSASNQVSECPLTDATAALEMLSRLCQESGWEWTDGLLLAGCLAYGLGEYSKALQCYSRALSCDPSNVEAMSNTAATLLSLHRPKEAEQYWLRSVKLQPSYFEAVEHLVGLLCGDQRGREAVKIIDFVEQKLQDERRIPSSQSLGHQGDIDANAPSAPTILTNSPAANDIPNDGFFSVDHFNLPRSGSSGYAIPASDNGRMLALVHAKGNMLYALGDNAGAARAFEDAILIGAGRKRCGITGLIKQVLQSFAERRHSESSHTSEPILLLPEIALKTAHHVFPPRGQLPGLKEVPEGIAKRAAVSTTSNSLLSLAKIYQDGMSTSGASTKAINATAGVQDILALYYLSLSLQPSPSTANNVGILLASVQQSTNSNTSMSQTSSQTPTIPGVVPGSGIALALAYYNYGLNLDSRHAHLYTNLGSLLKDIGQLSAAIKMYEQAVECDGNFDIALANLANAVKDQGRISDAIGYYKRAVTSNPDFAEAVCGLANALNSVCNWKGRGGIVCTYGKQDRWHVNDEGMLVDARAPHSASSGWLGRVVAIVEKQLGDGRNWGRGILNSMDTKRLLTRCYFADGWNDWDQQELDAIKRGLDAWAEQNWEGARIIRFIERATKRLGWQMYRDMYVETRPCHPTKYFRPQLPRALAAPSAPTVLPFHTFTCPLTAKQIRKISQRNGLRISYSTLQAPWLPAEIFQPPKPPSPQLNVGYVSSDFNNHPLAHLMQSVFGFHNASRVRAFCYATTASDNSVHREQIQREAPVFHDASSWSIDQLVNQIVADGIHVLVNLNGYTRGARNEVFAARPAPIQMSFMGFAGTLGAEWCDYLLADTTAIPPGTLRPWRRNVDLIDQIMDENNSDIQDDWIYGENVIFTRHTFFCCDHRQSAPDAQEQQLSWLDEQRRRWKMRKDLFPDLPDDAVILGNFNQLYKIEPTTFRTWLRILSRIPKAVLWLLRFPDLGENNLRQTAVQWAGKEVASRVIFTDVAPKHQHITRARICDLFLDTPECNAHTTAADVLWSGTPILTLPRYEYKMCSRMASSILKGALPDDAQGKRAAEVLIVKNDEEYEERAVELGNELVYGVRPGQQGLGRGRLVDLRKLLYNSRWVSHLFDTRRWVRDLENAYEEAWRRWVAGEGGDIWL